MREKKVFEVRKSKAKRRRPNLLQFENRLQARGIDKIAGVDEVGRGCLAGPVFAAAVILPSGLVIPEVDDSKKLKPQTRERLYEIICQVALAWSVASVDASEIDAINIHHASLKAMKLAIRSLAVRPEFILIDGKFAFDDEGSGVPRQTVIKGDGLSQSIAAASIIAKVSRDRWITEEGRRYPEYRFERHKGYGTLEHRRAIRLFGMTPLHRRSFRMS